MDWGIELWDKFDEVSQHSQKGIEYCEKVLHFYKERCTIERDYAKSLKKLVNSFNHKKKDENFSVQKGFCMSLNETFDMAGQHETIADRISEDIVKLLNIFIIEAKQNRKKFLQDGQRNQSSLQQALDKLDKAKKKYEKAFVEAEKAAETYKKNENDVNLPKIEIDKSKTVMENKQQQCEECKKDYAFEIESANKFQNSHFYTQMPEVFKNLQQQDESRIQVIKETILAISKIQKDVIPILNSCIEGWKKSNDVINAKEDGKILVDKEKTGFSIPGEIPFEDLSSSVSSGSSNGGISYNPLSGRGTTPAKPKKRQGLLGIFSPKSDEIKEDFSHLPPNQQRKQLNIKIKEIKLVLLKETQQRDALIKMRDVYAGNKNLGDPTSLDKQMTECNNRLNKLNQELKKFEGFLSNKGMTSEFVVVNQKDFEDSSSIHSRTSNLSINILSTQQDLASKPVVHEIFSDDQVEFDDEFVDGRNCTALYDYSGSTDDSSLSIKTGERFTVLEDGGDGWLKVKRTNQEEIGYVPSSYVQIN